jgi:hypothetical protein
VFVGTVKLVETIASIEYYFGFIFAYVKRKTVDVVLIRSYFNGDIILHFLELEVENTDTAFSEVSENAVILVHSHLNR